MNDSDERKAPVRPAPGFGAQSSTEGGGFLDAFRGSLGDAGSRVVLVVGAVVALAILGAVVWLLLLPSAVARREAAFEPALAGYTRFDTLQQATGLGSRRGKVVVVDTATGRLDPIFHYFPEQLRADTPEQAQSVVWITWGQRKVDDDRGAFVLTCQVVVIDPSIPAMTAAMEFEGSDPPDMMSRLPSDKRGGFGGKPVGTIIRAIQELTVVPSAVPAPSAPPSPLPDLAELQPHTFETVTLDAAGRQVGRQKGTARQFTETIASGVRVEMVYVPGGTFTMGGREGDRMREPDELPRHAVTVAPFYIGKFEVTQAQWEVVAGFPKVATELRPNSASFKGQDRPVEQISWEEAAEFCARLSRHTGRTYRLASEAEWEFASRGGRSTTYPSGEAVTAAVAVFADDRFRDDPKGSSALQTAPVGSRKTANGFGLFDVEGNVAEWCADLYSPSYTEAPADGSAWTKGHGVGPRVVRGGGYYFFAPEARSSNRAAYGQKDRFATIGFRLALSAG